MKLGKDKTSIHISRSGESVDITVTVISDWATASIQATVPLDELLADFNIQRVKPAKMTGDIAPEPQANIDRKAKP